MEVQYTIHASLILTIFFIMLGPMKLTGPFIASTLELERRERQILALKVGMISFISLIIAGLVGWKFMTHWRVSPPTLLLGAGILFLFASLSPLIHPFTNEEMKKVETTPQDIAIKLLITPFGLAVVIVLFSLSHDINRLLTIIGCLFAIIVTDVLAMAFANPQKKQNTLFKNMIWITFGTLQFALSLQIIINSLVLLGIITLA